VDTTIPISYAIDPALFASTFAVIFLAEIPDKTAMATLMLATGSRPFAVFVGVAVAFVIQSAVAVAFGSVITLFPRDVVRMVAGGLFLVFAVMMWRRGVEADETSSDQPGAAQSLFWPVAWKAFMVIFIAEWGDLTQLATAALAAKCAQPLTIFTAATLALWAVTALAVVVGQRLKHVIKPLIMQRVAAIVFALIGLLMLVGVGISGPLG
jgi:putative Ca2+/H+ antiporter (TMEM165/GDT1 family)